MLILYPKCSIKVFSPNSFSLFSHFDTTCNYRSFSVVKFLILCRLSSSVSFTNLSKISQEMANLIFLSCRQNLVEKLYVIKGLQQSFVKFVWLKVSMVLGPGDFAKRGFRTSGNKALIFEKRRITLIVSSKTLIVFQKC